MPQSTTSLTPAIQSGDRLAVPDHLQSHLSRLMLIGTQSKYLIGAALHAAEEDCNHGEWLPFLVTLGIPQPTAWRWMQAAQRLLPDDYKDFDSFQTKLFKMNNLPLLIEGGKAPRAADHDGNDEWYTPAAVVKAARAVMGRIDLDPASTSKANETVKAKAIYTVEDDGLTQPWRGRVFLNPPFSAQLKRAFCDRLRESVASGDVTQAVLVTPIDISPQWGDVIRTCASAVALAVGSTPFYGPRGEHGGPGFGHMVSYYGPNAGRFASVFGKEWSVWVRPTAQ